MASRGGATRPNGPNAGNKICQFKLVLLGESAVGKSSLVLRFVKGQFHEFQESTIGGEGHAARPVGFMSCQLAGDQTGQFRGVFISGLVLETSADRLSASLPTVKTSQLVLMLVNPKLRGQR